MITNRIGQLTELQANMGGVITEAYPTNFHTFHTSRILLAGETVEDYKEVTAAERAALEKQDKAWVEPPQEFIDSVEPYGVVYNKKTGNFNLNGLSVTYKEMIAIKAVGPLSFPNPQVIGTKANIRTNLPWIDTQVSGYFDTTPTMDGIFRDQLSIEVVNLSSYEDYPLRPYSMQRLFEGCRKLHTIIGAIMVNSVTTQRFFNAFNLCSALVNVSLKKLTQSMSFASSPLLSRESLEYLVENAANTSPIAITVHPDVYAKLTAYTKPVNLVKGGNQLYNRPASYLCASADYEDGKFIVEGLTYQTAMQYNIGEKDDSLGFFIWRGYSSSVSYYKGNDLSTKPLKFHCPNKDEYTGNVEIYRYAKDDDYDPETRVDWVVVTMSEVDEITEWVPSISEIEDEEEREAARWSLVREFARLKNIQFVTE